MSFEDLLQTETARSLIASLLGSVEFVADRLGPQIAKKYAVNISKNQEIPTWDQKTTMIDLYTPQTEKPTDGWPIALMIHGGGFRFFSKDSHAQIAAKVAEMGYLTVALNYRLAPKHPYPEGLIDTLSVYDWVQKSAFSLGGNLNNIVLVSESAGANFALDICLLASKTVSAPYLPNHTQIENWTIPKKAVLHCGYHQVSGTERYNKTNTPSAFVRSRVRMVQHNYLPESVKNPEHKDWGLADPLVILEGIAKRGEKLNENFSEVFIPVGESDPVSDDSQRLATVFEKLGHHHQFKIYPKAPHAFYAMPWHQEYQNCWNDIGQFLALK